MKDDNKKNILYFESDTMRGLFEEMEQWQNENKKRFLSTTIERDGDKYCCISLTNPSEVTIVGANGNKANVSKNGRLWVIH